MQSASDSLQSTLDNEDQNDPMVEAKNRGKEAALKFKMGGCCKICETRFYRDLAFLEEQLYVLDLRNFDRHPTEKTTNRGCFHAYDSSFKFFHFIMISVLLYSYRRKK